MKKKSLVGFVEKKWTLRKEGGKYYVPQIFEKTNWIGYVYNKEDCVKVKITIEEIRESTKGTK